MPCTPEVGLIDMFEEGHMRHELRSGLPGHAVNIDRLIQTTEYRTLSNSNSRTLAKNKIAYLVSNVNNITALGEPQIRRLFYRTYTKYKYGNDTGALLKLLGPVFNVRQA